ncbi:fimbria/pilus periplasmic chaperone [Paraburkholderia edwinii]|uniref:Fimbria/pilus periplasmic chaperone n=1 Tax=Paraburkholderia edwinii TaxID=2861782 RepID=A0ABX8UEK4_9BURK|nr:fimbria/pilus periplasmic chaperone [Paraburkholderia edwinii]QYD67172.1 fimbria/pilus periplasmic chaperone [Paraburkholderia edwinii]
MAVMTVRQRIATTGGLVAFLCLLLAARAASAQSLTVLPVTFQLPPGQAAAALTLVNGGSRPTSIQVRAFAWSQSTGDDQLTPSTELLASPPLATIAPGASQIVRLVLRRPPQDREATYRILIDQIPPPAEPGVVHVVLRLSLPVFAEAANRTAPARLQFQLRRDATEAYLVALNEGERHQAVRDIVLTTSDGRKLKTEPNASPYVLAGASRRWRIPAQTPLPAAGETVRLTANADTSTGTIDQSIPVVGGR